MSLTRRELVKTGAAGVVLLTLADCARGAPQRPIGPGERTIVERIADAMLDGAVPATDPQRSEALAAAVDGFSTAVAGLPPALQHEVRQLFSLLEFPPTRRLVAWLPPWEIASRDDVAAFLTRWRTSRLELLRSGYDALHQLVMAGWYGQDRAWARIGYPGPPRVA